MRISDRIVLVTGGAGFVGSHLVEELVHVAGGTIVFDNLSTGNMGNLQRVVDMQNFRFVKGDLLDSHAVREAVADCSVIFHLAANPEVRVGVKDPRVDFQQNLVATHNLLEAMRISSHAKTIMFASTSTVYGEARTLPTREDYGPVMPI